MHSRKRNQETQRRKNVVKFSLLCSEHVRRLKLVHKSVMASPGLDWKGPTTDLALIRIDPAQICKVLLLWFRLREYDTSS